MLTDSPAFEQLIDALRRLPGIGKRSAERLALHLLGAPGNDAETLREAIGEARARVATCSVCCDLTETDPCSVCVDERRDRSTVCVVEHPSGAMAIESGRAYRGVYHVLHGVLDPLEGVGPNELTVEKLLARVEAGGVKEVIVATNATAEGEATAMYLSRRIGALGVAVSRIAHGVPMGSGLEFADNVTLTRAIEGRRRL
ncbi:MAG TPA: recombination protein RecR [Candidatus Hydrogenedentes bacterium]|nr:recombination protein RecR [Candidatus Hydrogenedentota bacterium]HIJ73369.1 recombination protein RecR [Candidatus Hydrogenedentota bacterium]